MGRLLWSKLCKYFCQKRLGEANSAIFLPMEDEKSGLVSNGVLEWMKEYLLEEQCTKVDEANNTFDYAARCFIEKLIDFKSNLQIGNKYITGSREFLSIISDMSRLPVLIANKNTIQANDFLTLQKLEKEHFTLNKLDIETFDYLNALGACYRQCISEIRASKFIEIAEKDSERLNHHLALCDDLLGLITHAFMLYTCYFEENNESINT